MCSLMLNLRFQKNFFFQNAEVLTQLKENPLM